MHLEALPHCFDRSLSKTAALQAPGSSSRFKRCNYLAKMIIIVISHLPLFARWVLTWNGGHLNMTIMLHNRNGGKNSQEVKTKVMGNNLEMIPQLIYI